MIIGELITIVVLCVFWALFIIGIIGLTHEFKKGYLQENPSMIALHLVFAIFGFVFGTILLFWFFKITGIGEILVNMWNGWWNTKL